jgi:hypothetical protein
LNRVAADEEDRNCRGRGFGSQRRQGPAARDDDRNRMADKVFHQQREAVVLASSPSKFDCYIFALDIAGLIQSLPESSQIGHVDLGRPGAKSLSGEFRPDCIVFLA